MRVEPPCVAKRLSNAEPGELVKLHWGGHAMRAIIASIEYQGQRDQALVFLDSTGTESLFGRQLQERRPATSPRPRTCTAVRGTAGRDGRSIRPWRVASTLASG